MKPITVESTVSQRDDILTADMNGETVMMSIEKGNYYGMEKIPTDIWNELKEPKTVSQLCETLQARYDVDSRQCHDDVLAYLNDLHEEELIKIHDRPAD